MCLYDVIICNIGWACDNAKFARHRPGSWSHTHPRTSGSACQPHMLSQHVTQVVSLKCRSATSNASRRIIDTWCYLILDVTWLPDIWFFQKIRWTWTTQVPMCYGCYGLWPSLAVDSGKRRQCQDGLNNEQEKGDDSYYMLLYVAILDSFSLLLAVTPSLPFLFSWELLWRSRVPLHAVGRTQEFVIGVGLVGLWAFFLSRRKCGNVAHGKAKASKAAKKNYVPLSPPLPWPWNIDKVGNSSHVNVEFCQVSSQTTSSQTWLWQVQRNLSPAAEHGNAGFSHSNGSNS